jgi:hypothetical protein
MSFNTKEEWIQAFERWSGLTTRKAERTDRSDGVDVLSPTGIVVGQLTVYRDSDGAWSFGGCSNVFPKDWSRLCRGGF